MNNDSIYIYDGPVMQFDKVIQNKWIRRTKASTPEKALSNLQFQYKMIKQLSRNANIKLDKKYLRIEN